MVNADSWTAILLCRDTPQDRLHVRKTLPAIRRLGPDEILVGVDADVTSSCVDELYRLCPESRIICVERDKMWRLHPMHVLWECVQQATCDIILQVNADTVPNQKCLEGLEAVRKGSILASVREHYSTDTPLHVWRHIMTRVRWRQNSIVPPSGTYWMRRSSMLGIVPVEKARRIQNGFDTIWFDSAREAGGDVVLLPVAGAKIQGGVQHDLIWRQWEIGIWNAATVSGRHRRRQYVLVMIYSIVFVRPHVWKAYRWGLSHMNHPAVQAAQKAASYSAWSMTCTDMIKQIPYLQDKMSGVGSE